MTSNTLEEDALALMRALRRGEAFPSPLTHNNNSSSSSSSMSSSADIKRDGEAGTIVDESELADLLEAVSIAACNHEKTNRRLDSSADPLVKSSSPSCQPVAPSIPLISSAPIEGSLEHKMVAVLHALKETRSEELAETEQEEREESVAVEGTIHVERVSVIPDALGTATHHQGGNSNSASSLDALMRDYVSCVRTVWETENEGRDGEDEPSAHENNNSMESKENHIERLVGDASQGKQGVTYQTMSLTDLLHALDDAISNTKQVEREA